MKGIVIIVFAAFAAILAKEYLVDVHSPSIRISGRMHDSVVVIRDGGCISVCRTRPMAVTERNWLALEPRDSGDKVLSRVMEVAGVGKVIMLPREIVLTKDETEECWRGEAYIITKDGKWVKGIFSRRTLGWGKGEYDIWGDYSYLFNGKPRPDYIPLDERFLPPELPVMKKEAKK